MTGIHFWAHNQAQVSVEGEGSAVTMEVPPLAETTDLQEGNPLILQDEQRVRKLVLLRTDESSTPKWTRGTQQGVQVSLLMLDEDRPGYLPAVVEGHTGLEPYCNSKTGFEGFRATHVPKE